MRICDQEFSAEIIEKIKGIIQDRPDISRTKLSLDVCELLDWHKSDGRCKDINCRVALLRLHRRGLINLPESQEIANFHRPKNKAEIILDEIPQVEGDISELGAIKIIQIKDGQGGKSRIWNALMSRYHYLGSGPLCGAQMRYLIQSERYGYIGGFAFSSSAWRLQARDQWIGWDDAVRLKNLHKVVSNSRFLIHAHIKVKNLASYVLSLCMKRVAMDWQEKYGVKPVLLETFVERDRYKGSCYRASNWQHIGVTKGRGRQDCRNLYSKPIKDIYVYQLESNAREILSDGRPRLECKIKEPEDWADEEFGQAQLGDRRRVDRLLTIARDFYANPTANIPQACETRAKTKAAYRFFDEAENTMDKILAPHFQKTCYRTGQEKVVLSVQDTTTLSYNTHPATENLGPIRNQIDNCIGLLLHDTMAFNLEGTPLGLLDVQCWARKEDEKEKDKRDRHAVPIEEKESHKWLKSFHATFEAQKQNPDTVFVSVGDRESDIYDLFELALSDQKAPKLLVRANHNRILADKQTLLWDYVSSQPVSGITQIHIPRRKNKPARNAKLQIRFAKVSLKPPDNKKNLRELTIWAILAEEIECADIADHLEWMLLTTFEINDFEEAIEKLDWYTIRFWIEVYHKTLKSGCKIEQRQLGHADRIESCLAIDMVVAWRIFNLTKAGREMPDLPCTFFFEDAEWKALVAYKTQNPKPPEKAPSLREAIHMVASLGGFLGRKSDGEPGTKTLWLGLQRLDDMTAMWTMFMAKLAPDCLRPPPVSS
jgi:hypothetical protein